jgi:hypothetical protein
MLTIRVTAAVPARTHSMRKASGRQTARPSAVSSMPPPPMISISNSLGDIRRDASFASPTSPPGSAPPYQMQSQAQQQRHRSMPSPPPGAQHGMSNARPATAAAASRQGPHGRINSIGSASAQGILPPTPGAAAAVHGVKPMPPLPQGVDANGGRSTSNPFRDQPSTQPAQALSQKGGLAPGEHPPYVVPPTQSFILQHAAPALPTPAPPRPPPPGKLPLDALLGFDPAPNPFKQNKPRVVRPTPVVASAAAPVPNPFRTPVPRDREVTRAESVVSLGDDRGSQYGGAETSHGGLARSIAAGDRLPPPLPPRAGVSPLIQAGLNAASEVQRAKQALPPKTYTTIQRSATSAAKPTRREYRLLTGQVAPPEVIAPLAQRAAEREAELYGGNPPPRRKSSVGTSIHGQQRRSVSEAATMLRRGSEEEDAKNRSGHARASSSVTARSNVYSPDPYSRGGDQVTSKKLSRLQDDEEQHIPRPASNRPGITSVPSWLQEQEEIQRISRDNSLPSPIPEDIQFELDSIADEMSENAMSAASIERPGNPLPNGANSHLLLRS